MPFLSKDWRSPGEKWVRYDGGWEMKKTVWVTTATSSSSTSSSSSDRNARHHSPTKRPPASQPRRVAGARSRSGWRRDSEHSDSDTSMASVPSVTSLTSMDSALSVSPAAIHASPKANLRGANANANANDGGYVASVVKDKKAVLEAFFASRMLSKQRSESLLKHSLHRKDVAKSMISDEAVFNPVSEKRLMFPYYQITIKSTREIAGFNGLADALLRLDFINAVRDIRRFNYVSKIMYTLFSHDKLSSLPGAAQKVLFRMLEEMADSVYKSNVNEHVLRKLLDELHATLSIYHVWGSHLGSKQLFKHHLESKRKITEIVEKMQVQYKQDLASPNAAFLANQRSSRKNSSKTSASAKPSPGLTTSLPEECIREIVLRLSDPKDLARVADTCAVMNAVARERRVWRELVQTHFTKAQIEFVLKERPELRAEKDWEALYKAIKRKFGLREEYTELIHLCRKCRVLYWQSIGHPCLVENNGSDSGEASDADENADDGAGGVVKMQVPVLPSTFLSFFSV